MYKVILVQKEHIVNPSVLPGYNVVYLQSSKGLLSIVNHLRCLEYVKHKNDQTFNTREDNEWYSWRELNVDDIFETPSLVDTIILQDDDEHNGGYEANWLRNHLDLTYDMLNSYPEFFEI